MGTVDTFKGFLVQARDLSTPPPSVPILLGHFIPESEGEQTLDCDPMGVALEVSLSSVSLYMHVSETLYTSSVVLRVY